MRLNNLNSLILSCVIGIASAGVLAQSGPAGFGATATLPGPGLSGVDASSSISDVFLGKNTVGPYLLSWKVIDSGSETVWRDGARLQRNVDYSLDPALGALRFASPLRSGLIARVDYRLVPGKSTANTINPTVPLQFSLFGKGSTALSMSALIRPGAAGPEGKGGGPSSMLLGFGGNAQLGSSSLTSKLYLDMKGGNIGDRGGIQIADSVRAGFGQFSASYSRAGRGFSGGEESGIQAGKEILDASAALKAISGLQASASFRQTTELADKGQSAVTTVFGQKLTGALTPSTKLQATRTETTTTGTDGATTTKVADRIQIDQRIVPGTQATALFERNETATGGAGTVVQTTGLSIRSRPTSRLSLQGDFRNRIFSTGAEDTSNMRIDASPLDTLKIGAAVGERYNSKSALHEREATLEYNPLKNLVFTGLLQTRNEGANDEVVRGLTASARPIPFIEFSGGVKLRDSAKNGIPDKDAPDTYNVKMSLRLLRDALRLTGGVATNPEDDKGVVSRARSRSVGLQSTLGPLDLAGGYTFQNEYLAPRITTIVDLKLGWRFLPSSQITTSYRGATTQDASLLYADTYTLNLVHRLGTAMDFTLGGALTTYEKDGVTQPLKDYRAEAKLGLRF